MRRFAVTLAAAALVVATSPTRVGADHGQTKTVVGRDFSYEPTPTEIAVGDHLTFTNEDAAPHDVYSAATTADGSPLFASALITKGQSAPVVGVEELTPGSYAFYCSVHPSMTGHLVVGADDLSPVPLPDLPDLPGLPAIPPLP